VREKVGNNEGIVNYISKVYVNIYQGYVNHDRLLYGVVGRYLVIIVCIKSSDACGDKELQTRSMSRRCVVTN